MMITCKEDLYGTYVLNDNSGAIELYVDFINSFGIGNKIMEVEQSALALEVCRQGGRWVALWIVHSLSALNPKSVKLTLSDLKPEENMKSYKTYRECKIANPECDVAEITQKAIDDFYTEYRFEPVVKSDGWEDGYQFLDGNSSPRIADGYWKICDPADYCMTVKEFLDGGYRFEVGDLYINYKDRVCEIGEPGHSLEACNSPGCISYSDNSYILRSSDLEERPRPEIHPDSEFYKKPRTKVEWVPCDFSDAWQAVKAYCDGEELYDVSEDKVQCPEVALRLWIHGRLYRRIETPMTEREAFIEAACEIISVAIPDYLAPTLAGQIFDSGKFKLVN